MDHRRKAQMAFAGPQNHTGEVTESPMENFDITKTIFKTLDPSFAPMIKKQYAIELNWSNSALARIDSAVGSMLSGDDSHWAALKAHDPKLISFMEDGERLQEFLPTRGAPRANACTALHCTALHCTALHCAALHCTALNG
jgi:hypothetical protein